MHKISDSNLSESQMMAAEMLACIEFSSLTYQQVAEKLGVTDRTLRYWRKDPSFQRYLEKCQKEELDKYKRIADAALVEQIKKGNMRALELYYRVTGRLDTQKERDIEMPVINFMTIDTAQPPKIPKAESQQ